MPWNATWPIGTNSVKANKTPGQQNTTYIETELNKDHYWNIGVNEDGHHRFVQNPISGTVAVPTNPTLATGMNGVYYLKNKTAIESTAVQKAEPFHLTQVGATNHILQLGFRVLVVFQGDNTPITQAEVTYSHNINTQAAVNKGVAHDATGKYQINFATPLPSSNYIVVAGGYRDEASSEEQEILGYVPSASSNPPNSVMSTTFVKVHYQSVSGVLHNVKRGWVAIIGG